MKDDDVDYVRIASYIFIRDHFDICGRAPSGVLYNKYMTLLNRKLASQGHNMGLPHCWYRWGDEVVRYGMSYIGWNHDDPRFTEVSYCGAIPGELADGDPIVSFSEDFSKEFIGKYKGPEGAEMAIDEVYSDAPYTFQNDYRRLREALRISLRSVGFSNFKDYILSIFDSAMASFPEEFGFLGKQKEEYEAVFRMAVECDSSREDLFELSECFWFFFCYHLRLDDRCHENVKRSTLDVWWDMVPLEDSRYHQNIRTYAFLLRSDSYSDPVIDRMLREREESLSNAESILSRLSDVI